MRRQEQISAWATNPQELQPAVRTDVGTDVDDFIHLAHDGADTGVVESPQVWHGDICGRLAGIPDDADALISGGVDDGEGRGDLRGVTNQDRLARLHRPECLLQPSPDGERQPLQKGNEQKDRAWNGLFESRGTERHHRYLDQQCDDEDWSSTRKDAQPIEAGQAEGRDEGAAE